MRPACVAQKAKARAANEIYQCLGYAISDMLPVPRYLGNVQVGRQSTRVCRAAAETRRKRRVPTGNKLIFSHRDGVWRSRS